MKKFLIATSFFALFGLSSGISNAQEQSINIQEKSSERAAKIFDAIDENADGNINKDEFVQFHSKLVEKRMEKYMPEAKPENVDNVNNVEIKIEEEATITKQVPTTEEINSNLEEVTSEVENVTPEVEENIEVINTPEEEIIEEDETQTETTIKEPSF